MKKITEKRWGIDRKFGPATAVNLVQLVTVVWFGAAFYTTANSNQTHNDERFIAFADQRKIQNEQMIELQKAQNQLLIQFTAINVKMETQNDALKDIRDLLRPQLGRTR